MWVKDRHESAVVFSLYACGSKSGLENAQDGERQDLPSFVNSEDCFKVLQDVVGSDAVDERSGSKTTHRRLVFDEPFLQRNESAINDVSDGLPVSRLRIPSLYVDDAGSLAHGVTARAVSPLVDHYGVLGTWNLADLFWNRHF